MHGAEIEELLDDATLFQIEPQFGEESMQGNGKRTQLVGLLPGCVVRSGKEADATLGGFGKAGRQLRAKDAAELRDVER